MKRKVIAIMVLLMFAFNIGAAGAFADEDSENTTAAEETTATTIEIEIDNGEEPAEVVIIDIDPGTTPDETFYSIKRLFENVQLFLTFTAEDKAALLAEFAEKRLAEAQAMDEAGKLELVKEMVEEYAATLLEAQGKTELVLEDGQSLKEVIEKIEKLLDENFAVINKVKSELPDLEKNLNDIKKNLEVIKTASEIIEQLEEVEEDNEEEQDAEIEEDKNNGSADNQESNEVEENTLETKDNKQVTVSLEGLTIEEQVKVLRAAGYGFGEISIALSLAEKADENIDEVIKMRNEGLGWGDIAKELDVKKGDVAKKIGKLVLLSKVEIINEVEDDDDPAEHKLVENEEVDEENQDIEKNLIKNEVKNKIKELKLKEKQMIKELKEEAKVQMEEVKKDFKIKREVLASKEEIKSKGRNEKRQVNNEKADDDDDEDDDEDDKDDRRNEKVVKGRKTIDKD